MRGWLRTTAGGMPRRFWLLWAAALVNRCGAFVFIVLTFFLSGRRHLDAHQVGLVIGLIGGGGALGVLLGGMLADRWGRRGTQLLAQLGTAAALLLLGAADTVALIAAAGFLTGLMQFLARPALAAMLVDVVPAADRTRAFSLNHWAGNLAFVVAALLGGWLAALDYRLVFAGDAATCVLAGVVVFLAVGETRPTPTGDAHPAAAGSPWRDRTFLGLCALGFLLIAVIQQYASTLPLAMARDGLSAAGYGLVMSVNAVVIVLGQPFVPRLLRDRDLSHTLAFASVVIGAGFGLTALAHTALSYAGTVFVWAIGEVLLAPGTATLVAALSPTGARGRYQGAVSLATACAMVVAPIAGGFVLDRFGAPVLWLGCLGVAAAVSVAHLASAPARSRRTVHV